MIPCATTLVCYSELTAMDSSGAKNGRSPSGDTVMVRSSRLGYSSFKRLTCVIGIVLAVGAVGTGGKLLERLQSIRTESRPALVLKGLIEKDLPKIAMAGLDGVARVGLLRQWAYENTDWSTPGANLDDDPTTGFYEVDAPELFRAFRNDRGGVNCGGTAYAFMRLCQMYDYFALTVDMGIPGRATHVVTLVRLADRGRDVWSVQDATFDVSYVHRDGAAFDYLDLLRALRDRQSDRIHVEKGDGRSREVIVAPDDAGGMSDALRERMHLVGSRPEGALKYRRGYSLAEFNEARRSSVAESLRRDGLPGDPTYLFLYPIWISGGRELDRQPDRVPRSVRPHVVFNQARKIATEARR